MTRLLLGVVVSGVLGGAVCAARPAVRRFVAFEQLRDAIVAKIARAQWRVWVVSPYLSDYDISLELYLAAHRKLDVRVVLGQERAQDVLSQYDYLRTQQVVVRVASAMGTTTLICDDRMYRIGGDLDFLTERRRFVLRPVVQPDIESYALALGVVDPPVHGRVYDYSRRRHKRPGYISGSLPRRTIRTLKQKSSGGSS